MPTEARRPRSAGSSPPTGPTPVVVTGSAANRGFSAAHNGNVAEALAAGLDAVLVLNPDIVLEPSTVEELARGAGDALGGPVLVLADPLTMRVRGAHRQRRDPLDLDWPTPRRPAGRAVP